MSDPKDPKAGGVVDQAYSEKPTLYDEKGGGVPATVDPLSVLTPGAAGSGGVIRLPMDPDRVIDPVALVLGGGGTIGDFQMGAMDFIQAEFLGSPEGTAAGFPRRRFDIATGSSVGAVNAGAIAQNGVHSMAELKEIWFGMKTADDFYVLNSAIRALMTPGGGIDLWRVFSSLVMDMNRLYATLAAQQSVMVFGSIALTFREIESYWTPAGPGLRGASIAVGRDLVGHRIVYARSYEDTLYARWQCDTGPISSTTRWSSWLALGGPISSDPAVYTTGVPGRPDNPARAGVLARLENEDGYGGRTLDEFNDVAHLDPPDTTRYNPFRPWADVPPPTPARPRFSSQPTIVQRAPHGRAMAFCRDENRLPKPEPWSSYFSTWNGLRWGEWTAFGHATERIAGNITGCSYFQGEMELFTRADSFVILHSFTEAGAAAPADWTQWPGLATSDLLVVLTENPQYIVDVLFRGSDGQVWTRRKVGVRGAWGPMRPLGLLIASNLAYGRSPDGTCSVYARGVDDYLWELRQLSPGGEWPANRWSFVGAPPGFKLAADPCTPADALGGIEVYVVASDRSIWAVRRQDDGTYAPWISLGGNVWTGTKLRMCSVALETGEPRYVDETGRFTGTNERLVSSDGDVRFARAQGALASCSVPGVFPPVALNDKAWVDGGMRYGLPIGAAIAAGATRVIAIPTVTKAMAAVKRLLPRSLGERQTVEHALVRSVGQFVEGDLITKYRDASVLDIAARNFIELLVNATSVGPLEPETPWPVPVWVIQQTFKTHEGGVIDPGLIRINYSYGWMRAFDTLMTSKEQRPAAVASTDRIIDLRWSIWKAEARFREAHLTAVWHELPIFNDQSSLILADWTTRVSNAWKVRAANEAAESAKRWLAEVRAYKRALVTALRDRRTAGFPIDPDSANWIVPFEMCAPQAHWPAGWRERTVHVASPFDKVGFVAGEAVSYDIPPEPYPTLDG